MQAVKTQKLVPKVLRDQLLLTMHYEHGYGELKAMFHISIQSVRKILSIRSINSTQRFDDFQTLVKLNKLTDLIVSAVNDMIDSKRDRLTVSTI